VWEFRRDIRSEAQKGASEAELSRCASSSRRLAPIRIFIPAGNAFILSNRIADNPLIKSASCDAARAHRQGTHRAQLISCDEK